MADMVEHFHAYELPWKAEASRSKILVHSEMPEPEVIAGVRRENKENRKRQSRERKNASGGEAARGIWGHNCRKVTKIPQLFGFFL